MGQPAYDRNAARRRRAPQPQRKANLRVAKGGKRRLNPLQAAVHNAMNLVAAALLVGFASFASRLERQIGKSHRSHLVERCALLIVLAFGEVVIGIGNSPEAGYSLLDSAFLLLLALGLFLIYLN